MIGTITLRISSYTLFMLGFLLAGGCTKDDSTKNRGLQAQIAPIADKSAVRVFESTGESLFSGKNMQADAGCRIAAIMDALRIFALQEEGSETRGNEDSLKLEWEWKGLSLHVNTHRRNGLLTSDSMILSLDEFQNTMIWSVKNMKFINSSFSSQDKALENLLDGLNARDISFIKSYPLGSGIWQEVVQFKQWDRQ